MTEKAQKILQKLRPVRLFRSPEVRDRALQEFNQSTLNDVGPMGGSNEMAVLKDINDFQSDHDQFIKSLGSRV